MDLVIAVIGLLVVAAGLLDMFRTLLHPSGNGRLSSWVMRVVWWQSKLTGHRLRSASGTVAMMAVVLMWLVLQVLGWAIVYYPYVPDGFAYAFNIDHADYHYVAEALYLSLVTIATLGFGDVVGTGPWYVSPRRSRRSQGSRSSLPPWRGSRRCGHRWPGGGPWLRS